MTGEELQKIVEDKIRDRLVGAAHEIIDRTNETYNRVIDIFYDDYDPNYYARSYSFYNTVHDHYVQLDDGFEAGITTDASGVVTTHDPGEYVFNGGFGLGIHGTSQIYRGKPGNRTMVKWQKLFTANILPEIVKRHIGSLSI